jgi:Flp pilus assembly protein TadB
LKGKFEFRGFGELWRGLVGLRGNAALVQLGALVCLTPIKRYGINIERIIAFVVLSMMAWTLNIWCRRSLKYQRRALYQRRVLEAFANAPSASDGRECTCCGLLP